MAEGQSAGLPLFRREVLEARQAQWLGSIRIGRPLSFSVVTGASLAMAAALVAFARWDEVTRKLIMHGVLLPVGKPQALAARRASLETERRLTEQHLRQRQAALQQRLQTLQAEERQTLAVPGAIVE